MTEIQSKGLTKGWGRNRGRRLLAGVALAFASVAAGVGLDSSPAAAADRSADFTGYCKARYSAPAVSVSAWHAWVGSWTAVTWRCRQTSMFPNPVVDFAKILRPVRGITYSVDHQIDVNALCRWQYGSRSYAKLVGQSWSDWRCVT
jgi:hypothetical protein